MPDIATNKQASYRYHLLERWEAGLVLTGTEVKSLRGGKAQLKDGYAQVQNGEVWLHNVHIPPYAPATRENHEPERPRKLLMHKREIERLMGRTRERGRAIVVVLAALGLLAAHVPAAGAQTARAAVVGGTAIPVESAPWQVYLRIGSTLACGGSVLDARRVLTAAHCVIPEGTTTPRPPSSLRVLAGFTNVSAQPSAGSQTVGVASFRTHPLYDAAAKADDVAILTLAAPLTFNAKVRPIALAPVGGGPAPGAPLGFTGYGAQVQGQVPDGKLYGASLTAVSDVDCRTSANPNATASVQCVAPGNPAPCFADSGGPLTAGGVQVGIASYAPPAGCGQGPSGFTDVTAPEVRAWIDDPAAAVPVAPRLADQTVIFATQPPVVASPMTCSPGTWSGATGFTYTFLNAAAGQALDAGRGATFTPPPAHRGGPR